MHGSQASVANLVTGLGQQLGSVKGIQVVICPPMLYLSQVKTLLAGADIMLGAQDVCAQEQQEGAYTGEVSAAMLADIGCRFVLVGHSERRDYQHESSELVAQKFIQVQKAGLTPVLCMGESLDQREAEQTFTVLREQLMTVVERAGIAAFANAVLAYEPIWAIGTGKTASPAQAQEVHAWLRGQISELDEVIAARLRILYGGSVKAANAAELFAKPDIDGALVGGASLKADEFAAICRAAAHNSGQA